MTDGGRAQDQGRPHRAKGRPSPATASLLARYQQAMRDELGQLLEELAPKDSNVMLLDGSHAEPSRPPVAERARLWSLAIQLGRELGTEVDASPAPSGPAAPPSRPRRGRVDYG
jgi:hypothetical protein